ncbi:MAG: hypothetical protein MK101_10365 [Phycisphaerales bacterium]|nr:hypothetical protein [Phycisphaerales bacterium]
MRVDHLAFQKALNITVMGLLLQAAVGTLLLVFGLAVDDSPAVLASIWCLAGLIPWVGLLVVFAQHRLERLESLEEDELSGSGAAAMFDRSGEAIRPAARRLRQTYRWILPAFSLAFAIGLTVAGWLSLDHLQNEDLHEMPLTASKGWLEAILLATAALTFVWSRYLAGMAAQEAWRHFRAGAGQMVVTSLVLGLLAVGVGFRFFGVDGVVEVVAWAIPILMFAVALEIVLSLVLDAYRPRRAGEFPRAAFDSPSLGLLAQPGSVVRSINEAVNYQFGFDITSSWGYQLLLRSSLGLGGLAIIVLLLMSTVVVVGPRQEGIRLRQGAIVGGEGDQIKTPGPFGKLPWPLESAQLYDVTSLQTLPVTPVPKGEPKYFDWREPPDLADGAFEPAYIVKPSGQGAGGSDEAGDQTALVVPHVRIVWRVANEGLLDWLEFVPDERLPRQQITQQQRALQMIANAQMTQLFSGMRLDQVLSTERNSLGELLKTRIQDQLDKLGAGIVLVTVEVPEVRPPKDAAIKFESLPAAIQQRQQWVAAAERQRSSSWTRVVGDTALVDDVIKAIDAHDAAQDGLATARSAHGADSPEAKAAGEKVEATSEATIALLKQGGGTAWQSIANAERDALVDLMNERARVSRLHSQAASWRAAPELYRQRALMGVYARMLPKLRKYVVGVDPARLDLNVELREHASPNTIFSDTLSSTSPGDTGGGTQ